MKFQLLKTLTLILCFAVLTAPAMAQNKVFNAEYFKLDNGMEIVVIPNNRAPVITHMVWYRVGAADEKPGHSGLAHFLEHLMFKGSLGFGPGEFSKTIKALGGNDNAFTSQDFTAYFQSVASKHLELVMRMEAGRMRKLNPPIEEVDSERKVVQEERRQRTDNNPRGRFSEALNNAIFVNHPYNNPVIGWGHEIAELDWESAKAFYDQYYGPNNAVLVVSGDVTGEQVHTLAKEIYGKIEPIELSPREWPVMPKIAASTIIEMTDPTVQQPIVNMTLIGPNSKDHKEDALALQVLQEIMGGGSTSRVYKSLVKEKKIASQAGFYYDSESWGPGEIQLFAYPLPGISPETIKQALHEEIEKLLENGVTDQELKDAKTRLIDQAVYARDSLSGPAMIVGRSLVTGSTLDDIEYWPRDIDKVTKNAIDASANKYLDTKTNRIVYGQLLPEQQKETNEENES